MAEGYGIKTSDWLILGLAGTALYFVYKTISKPVDMLGNAAGQVYGDVKDFGKGILDTGSNIFDTVKDTSANVIDTVTNVADNAINYKETVTNPDKSTTTYKGNYAQVKFGEFWDKLTGNNKLSSPSNISYAKTPTGTYGTALDLGGYLISSAKPTNYFSNIRGEVYGMSYGKASVPSSSSSSSSSKSSITSKSSSPKAISSSDYTNGRLNAGTYKTSMGIVKVSKAYKKKK